MTIGAQTGRSGVVGAVGAGTSLHLVTRSGGGDLQEVFVMNSICDPWKSHALTTHPLVLFWCVQPRPDSQMSLMDGISAIREIRQLGKLNPTPELRRWKGRSPLAVGQHLAMPTALGISS